MNLLAQWRHTDVCECVGVHFGSRGNEKQKKQTQKWLQSVTNSYVVLALIKWQFVAFAEYFQWLASMAWSPRMLLCNFMPSICVYNQQSTHYTLTHAVLRTIVQCNRRIIRLEFIIYSQCTTLQCTAHHSSTTTPRIASPYSRRRPYTFRKWRRRKNGECIRTQQRN